MFSNTFVGIAPSSAPTYVAAQVVGGVLAVVVIRTLHPKLAAAEAGVVVPLRLVQALRSYTSGRSQARFWATPAECRAGVDRPWGPMVGTAGGAVLAASDDRVALTDVHPFS
jgi:hypothetical protein